MMNADAVREAVELSLAAGHFFVAEPTDLQIARTRDEDVPWQMFGGHLLDSAHSTEKCRFDAWHVELVDRESGRMPFVSAYWDRQANQIAIVRRILTHGYEAYEDSPGVILSRPAQKWSRELVGTIDLAQLGPDELGRDLRAVLFLAVIGVSRLPITSLESPLPGFSLGEFAYFPNLRNLAQKPWRDSKEALHAALASNCQGLELIKVLETALRSTPDAEQPRIAHALIAFAAQRGNGADRIDELLRGLFRYVALSPYGNYVVRLVALLSTVADRPEVGTARVADVIASMLTQLSRHLTAFDLSMFHNSGANYPDALYLDELLKLYFSLIERQPRLFGATAGESEPETRTRRLRRRALRQGCLLRRHYEGLLVPDAPTSQGEALRVLPEPFVRVPEEQLLQPRKRRRKLFADEPLEALLTPTARQVLQQSLADLDRSAELRELGTAFFLDRPLGVSKRPGEVDRTPLVSYAAVSRAVIKRRLGELLANDWISRAEYDRLQEQLEEQVIVGVAVAKLQSAERPGVVSLADALKVSSDFMLVRSTVNEALRHYEWPAGNLPGLEAPPAELGRTLLVHHSPRNVDPTLHLYDSHGHLRLELGFESQPDGRVRFVERAGVELPARLQALRSWEFVDADVPVEHDQRPDSIWLTLRDRKASD